MTLCYKEINSPVGKLKIIAGPKALVAIEWERAGRRRRLDATRLEPRHPILCEAERQLNEYFAGTRTCFDLPLQPEGREFEKRVWQALRRIPYGQTRSYLEIAKAIGSPKACRAVGAANSRNPLPIVVPCHRVIGAGGALTGFAGGLERKAALLAHEACEATRAAHPQAASLIKGGRHVAHSLC